MKPLIKIMCIFTVFLTSCSEKGPKYDTCSISTNNIVFTKSLNNGDNLATPINKGKLQITCEGKSDFFNDPNGDTYANAPLLLTEINNNEPFTFITKVSPQLTETYDAGALYVFVNNKNWIKFAFEKDEKKRTRIVTVRTKGTSDDNNHDAINVKSVFMKIASNAESIGFYYATDSIDWQLVRVFKNDFPSNTLIGISSQSPLGTGNTTTFENFSLNNVAIKDFRKGI